MPSSLHFTRWLTASALAGAALTASTVHAQSYVNVTVGGVFSPGVYGQITFGNAPRPPVYNPRPVIVAPVVVGAPVVYMHVPEEHRRHWSRHCNDYRACGYPVQFVQVNVNNRWWDGRSDYRHGDRYEDHDEGHGRHDNGRHRGHDKHRGD
jgi:hypothetical protein